MAQGISTVVQASEYYDQGLQELADAFARLLPGKVHVQLYATPGGAHSYGWHYDFEDVFIAQTLGVKDYYLRDNTVARHTRVGQRLDFTCIRAETSKLMSARLVTGDWLYIPHRWWHLVKCVDSALSISVGIMPRS
jgi:ribosomal protein L16 Arg81 hydroxylase